MSDDFNAAPDAGTGDNSPVEVITPAADTGTDLSPSQAARALAAARYAKRDNPAPVEQPTKADAPVEPQELAEANTDPAEEPIIGEDAEVAEPADREPPIERPRSWTKDEDAEWQSLPRAMQQKIVAREQERDTGLRRSQNEAAEHRKALEAERTQAEQARKQYEAKLPELLQTLQEVQAGQFADIKTMADVERLVNEDPFRYNQWTVHQQKLQAIANEKQRIDTQAEKDRQTEWARHVQAENALFEEAVPEAADQKNREVLASRAANELLPALGFKTEELNALVSGSQKLSLFDHRVQRLIFNSLKLADIEKAKSAVVSKPLPQVQRPGTARSSGDVASEALQALERKATSSGSLKDMQALRAAQIAARVRRAS